MNANLPKSVLVKKQSKTFGPCPLPSYSTKASIVAKVRYDDQCGNGHNTFAITAVIRERGVGEVCFGCCHEDIEKAFPELAPMIKWHLVSSDGPMHYIANTVYHAEQHEPNMAHVYFADPKNEVRETCVKYCSIKEAEAMVSTNPLYLFKVDVKTEKKADYEAARSAAVWPEATDAELAVDRETLTVKLEARLSALMVEFKAAVESLGFTY